MRGSLQSGLRILERWRQPRDDDFFDPSAKMSLHESGQAPAAQTRQRTSFRDVSRIPSIGDNFLQEPITLRTLFRPARASDDAEKSQTLREIPLEQCAACAGRLAVRRAAPQMLATTLSPTGTNVALHNHDLVGNVRVWRMT